MEENTNAVLIIQTYVKSSKTNDFMLWQEKLATVIEHFPGYVSQTITPPQLPVQPDWIIIQRFVSTDAAKKWIQSSEREYLLQEGFPCVEGIDTLYLIEEREHTTKAVTATIATTVDPENTQTFLAWQLRIAPMQSRFPGFIGYSLEEPRPGINDAWITILTFDTEAHLDTWLQSQERKEMVEELNTFSSTQDIQKTPSGFDFWFNQSLGSHKKSTQKSIWKENMLVLLTLYPIVCILTFVLHPLDAYGVPFWLMLFIGNALSTILLGWATVPWLINVFDWWLNPSQESSFYSTVLGCIVVLFLYSISLVIGWYFSPFLS